MTENELELWGRYEAARKELILLYLPLVELMAKRIARNAPWANWEDLKQDGIIGLMKAIEKFDPGKGVRFKAFAKHYIHGAIYDSSALTRNLARQQQENCRKIKEAEKELTQTLQRNPTIEEVAEETGLTIKQIQNAIDALGVAFAGELSETEDWGTSGGVEAAEQERVERIYDALATLSEREQKIIGLCYWDGLQDKEIAGKLGLTVSNASKIRQRAIIEIRKLLDVKKEGEHDEE